MEYFAKRNLFNNNRNLSLLLNDISYNQKYSKNFSRLIPSYSGNPNLVSNQKETTNIPRYHYLSKKNQGINLNETFSSKYKINNNTNDIKVSIDYAQYSRYEKPIYNYNDFISNNFELKNSPNKNENSNLNNNHANFKLRSKIWDLSNNHQKKAISKNFSMEYLPIKNKYNFSLTKKKLILDLDETLVHSGFNPFTRQSDITLQINVDGKLHTINILKRPYVDEFLKEISNFFEIYVFTASMEEYASPVIDLMNKNNVVKGKFFRQDCIFTDGLYIKDLYKVSNNLKDVIIIDNNPSSYVTNEDNGIPIKTWYEDLNDNELMKLIPLLKYLSNVDDVRSIIRQIVDKRNNEVDFNAVNKIINENDNKNYNNNNGTQNYNSNNDIKNYNSNNFNNNTNTAKRYGNNFYHEINESKKNKDRNYNYYSSNYNRYEKYNNINSFSNMSYNEIQNEAGHLNKNYNNDINYMQRNQNNEVYKPHFYYNNDYMDNNPLLKSSYNDVDKNKENLQRYSSFKIKENTRDLNYDEDLKNYRPFTPNINKRKINTLFKNENNIYEKIYKDENKNKEIESGINNYYEKIIYNQDDNQYKKIYNNTGYLRLNTQNILNRSSSDIYQNIKRNNDSNNNSLKRYNYLLNMSNISNLNNLSNNNEKRTETEANNINNIKNELDNDYYLESYKKKYLGTKSITKDYNNENEIKYNNTAQILRQTKSNTNIINSPNLNYLNKSNNYLNYLDDYKNNNLNLSKNSYEKKFEKYNYYDLNDNNNNNNQSDYFSDGYQSKKPTNLLFNNFLDFIKDKKRDFIKEEEDKNKNFENTYNKKINKFEKKDYLGKNVMKNFNYSNKKNYLQRTNLQNLIDVYKSKFKALENFININKNKSALNKTFGMNKKY